MNQQVVHELVALELLTLLLDKPTDDSVEVAVGFLTECGSIIQDLCPRGLHGESRITVNCLQYGLNDWFILSKYQPLAF